MNLVDTVPINLAPPQDSSPAHAARVNNLVLWLCALLIFAAGVFVRVVPSAGFTGAGFDEVLYRNYVIQLEHVGVAGYPAMCEHYLQDQRKPETMTKLPPTRFLYIFSGYLWKRALFGDARAADVRSADLAQKDPALVSLRNVSCFFSILLLILAGVSATRMFGSTAGLGVFALMAFAPLQIHMGQHALIDGFFAFWATLCLWTLWENLRHPDNPRWLVAHACSLVLMVLTKENAFFVYVAFWGLLAANRWTQFGTITPKLLLVMCGAPLLGVAILVTLSGGVESFIEIYQLLVAKAETLRYAIMTGDGPWYRYLVDLMVMSPIVLCLALTGLFTSVRQSRELLFSRYLSSSVISSCAT